MNSSRRFSIIFGVLLMAGIICGIFSSVPVLETQDYLKELPGIRPQVLAAVFFQASMALVYVALAFWIVPLLKQGSYALALGYFGFRIIGAAFLFVGIVSLLVLMYLADEYSVLAKADASEPARNLQILAELVRRARDWFNHVAMILPWSVGGLLMFLVFRRMGIVPAWIYLWGLAASMLTLLSTVLLMLGLLEIVTPAYFLMNSPMALLEIVFSVWLYAKGFPDPISVPGQGNLEGLGAEGIRS